MVCHFLVPVSGDIKQYSGIQLLLIAIRHKGMPEHMWMDFNWGKGFALVLCYLSLPFV